jgi:outer membrane biosynthesis protein TonB
MEEIQETFSFTPMLMVFEEEEIMEEEIMEEEIVMEESMIEETPMTTSFFSTVTQEEEIYEETEEITASFLPMVSQEEEMVQEEEEIIEESPIMESAQEEVIEEEETVGKGPLKMVQRPNEEKKEEKAIEEKEEVKEQEKEEVNEEKKVAQETEEKGATEKESSSESTTKIASKNSSKQKKIQQEKALVKNIDRVMDKVDSDVKDISKNLQIKNIIKIQAMTSEQESLALYEKMAFYRPKDIYLEQINIFDNRQIYPNTSLASYIKNDKVAIKAETLYKLNIEKQRIIRELETLKNGKI